MILSMFLKIGNLMRSKLAFSCTKLIEKLKDGWYEVINGCVVKVEIGAMNIILGFVDSLHKSEGISS